MKISNVFMTVEQSKENGFIGENEVTFSFLWVLLKNYIKAKYLKSKIKMMSINDGKDNYTTYYWMDK